MITIIMGFIIRRLAMRTENINTPFKNPPNKYELCIIKLIPIKVIINISIDEIKSLDLIIALLKNTLHLYHTLLSLSMSTMFLILLY